MKTLKKIKLILILLLLFGNIYAQKVGITDDSAEPPTFAPKSLLHIHHELATGSMFQITNSTSGDLVTDGFLINLITTSNKVELINKENAGMSFWTNNTEKVTILSGGNVGINAANPVEKLQVGGDVYITGGGGTIGGTTLANGWLKIGTTLAMDDNEFYYGTTGYIGTIGAFDLLFNLNGAERMRITSGGNIGIGITGPTAQLHTTGTVRFANYPSGGNGAIVKTDGSGNLSITNFTGNTTQVLLGNATFGTANTSGTAWQLTGNSAIAANFIGTTNAIDFRIYTSNAERMTVEANGNVGIGTTGPTAQLHTTGTVRLANYSNGFTRVDGSGNIGTRAITISGTGVSISNGNGVAGDPVISLDYGNSSTGSPRPVGNFGQFENHGIYTDFNTVPNYWGWNYVQASTNAPNATSSQWYRGVFSLGGNYPARGAGGYSMELAFPRYNHGSAGIWMRTIENGGIGGWTRIDANGIGVSGNINYVAKFTSPNAVGNSQIFDNGTNVGIGTSTPGAKLHISAGDASLALFGPNASWGGKLYVGASPNQGVALTAQVIATDGNLHLDPAPSKNMYLGYYQARDIYINPNGGNVGIGTTAPGDKLVVNGPTGIRITDGSYNANLVFGANDSWKSGIRTYDNGDAEMRIWHGNADGQIILTTGYNGDQSTAYPTDGLFMHGNKVGIGYTGTQVRDGSAKFSVNGNVGIGTTTPAEKLDVVGNIKASGVAYWGNSGTRTETKDNAGTMGGRSGYYETSTATPAENWPTGAASWWHLLDVRHSNTTNNYAMQFAGSFFDQDLWFRKTNNNAATAWTKVITTANIGSYGDNLGNHIATMGIKRSDHHVGHLEGSYNNVGANSDKSNPIYTIGSAYNPTATALSNMYGIGYSHDNFWTVGSGCTGWGMYVAADGDIRHILDASTGVAWASGSMRSPIFYDSGNTAYYWDGTGNQRIAGVTRSDQGFNVDGNMVIDDGGGWHRSYGATGWYNGTYGGGVWMDQSTYVRVYNGKGFTVPGSVGIGTTAPSTNLDVNGTVRIRGGSPSAGTVLTATDANGNAIWSRYKGQTNAGSVTAGNWYRIASNSGNRANAEFTLRDFISGGGHSTLTFRAGISYNNEGGMSFTVLNHSYYSTATFTKIRILEASTYDPQYLEVYVARTGSVDYSIYDNGQSSGWTPVDWTAGSIPGGYNSREYEVNNLFVIGDYDDRVTVNRGGNVGIGTTSPGAKLHIVGDFYNQGFVGGKSAWSDPGGTAWTNVSSKTLTTHGTGEDNSVIIVNASMTGVTHGGFVVCWIRVLRDGAVIGSGGGGAYANNKLTGSALTTYDEPGAGSHTYVLQYASTYSTLKEWHFVVFELKR